MVWECQITKINFKKKTIIAVYLEVYMQHQYNNQVGRQELEENAHCGKNAQVKIMLR